MFYLSAPVDRRGLVAALSESMLTAADLPAATVYARPRDLYSSEFSGWSQCPRRHGLSITLKQGDAGPSALAELIRTLPPDTALLTLESLRRGWSKHAYRDWWSLVFQDGGRNGHQHVLDDCIRGVFNTRVFQGGKGYSRARSLVDACVRVMANVRECYYGHFEVADQYDARGGYIYWPLGIMPSPPFHRLHNSAVWWSDRTDRTRCVRDVFWGNFLGPSLATRFDPDQQTTRRFLAYAGEGRDVSVSRHHYVTRFDSGAMFIALSESPMTCAPNSSHITSAELDVGAWLRFELRARGMLP